MNKQRAQGNVMKSIGVAALICGVLLLIFLGAAIRRSARGARTTANRAAKPSRENQDAKWLEAYGKLPLRFEENMGQTAREVRYVAHGDRYELFLTAQEAVVALARPVHLDLSPRHRFATLRALREARQNARQTNQTTALRLQLEGSNPQPQIAGTHLLPGRVNYFIGNDPQRWHTDVPTYAQVKYVGVYPGVDLVFYGNGNHLEYDFTVAPGADPAAIALNLPGAQKMRIDARGDVVVSVPGGEVRLQKPVIYQQVKGERREVAGSYTIAGNHRIKFAVSDYDRTEPLVLDPVLNYSTYVGGTSEDYATGIAVDSSGDAYITGATFSTNFPTTSNGFIEQPLAANTGASYAAFVAELNPAGTTLLYSSYIAGSTPGEVGLGIAADPSGKAVYVTGSTLSPDFPTNSTITGFKTGTNPTATVGTSFLVKLDPTQTTGAASFVYSTFIGGTDGPPATAASGDFGNAVAADSNGIAYVTGYTDSSPGTVTDLTTFPIVGGFQATLGNSNGGGNAFLAKINTTVSGSSSLVSSSYLGGDAALYTGANSPLYGDTGFGVAIDSSANAYVVGTTTSSNLGSLTTNGLSLTYPTGNTSNAAFFAEINTATAGSQSLSYLTYLGGSGADFGNAIAIGPSNVAYLTGSTSSLNFPVTAGAYQTTGSSLGVAFVSLFNTTLSVADSLTYSTFLGGTNSGSEGRGIQADSGGNAYVAGATSSTNFPVTQGALQTAFATGAFGNGFVSELNPGLSTLLYSSYFGGSGNGNSQDIDSAESLALDSSTPPNVYIAGQTSSTNLPIEGTPVAPLNVGLSGPTDAYAAKLSLIPTLAISPSPFTFPGIQQIGVATAPQPFVVTNNTSSAATFTSIAVTGTSPAANTDFAISSNGCSASGVGAGLTCTINVTFTPSVGGTETANLVIMATVTNGGQSSMQTFTVALTGTGSATAPGVGFDHASVSFGGQMLTTTSAAIPVKLTSSGLGPLTINSIAASGDFAETNTCPTSPTTLAPGGTCTISVTFAPTATGARTGTLTITDNASGSPQTIPLTGSGWDFQVTAPASASGKNPVTFNATMTPLGGFNQSVAFTCTAPTGTACTIATPITATDGMTAQSVAVTVKRSGSALLIPPPPSGRPPISIRQIVPLILALLLLFSLAKIKGRRVRLALATAVVLLVVLAGCSSTPPVSGNLTITGTSSGTAGSESHSTTVAITIN
jgi:hypothetical protein